MFPEGTVEAGLRPRVDFERLLKEDRILLTELAKQEGVTADTIKRATTIGTLSSPGAERSRRRVYLETIRIMGRYFTSREAWIRFIAACNGAGPTGTDGDGPGSVPSVPARRTAAQRKAAAQEADRLAASLGC